MKKFHVFSALLALAAFAMLAGPALAQYVPPAGSTLLFQDTYNTAYSADINADINSPTRVAGSLAGQVAYDTDNMLGLRDLNGASTLEISQGGDLWTRFCVGLTKDFNGSLAQGGLVVVANVFPRNGFVNLDVGHISSAAADVADTWLDGNWYTHPGFYGCVFDGVTIPLAETLSAAAFGTDGTTAWPANLAYDGGYSDYVEVALVCTDTTDNNPFNGSGTIQVDMYVNGGLFSSTQGPDFAHNYIAIGGNSAQYASIQDLRVYQIPEPGTLALLAAAAGFAFVWFRRR